MCNLSACAAHALYFLMSPFAHYCFAFPHRFCIEIPRSFLCEHRRNFLVFKAQASLFHQQHCKRQERNNIRMQRNAAPKGHFHFAFAAYQYFLEQNQQASCEHAQALLHHFNHKTRCARVESTVNACDVPLRALRKRNLPSGDQQASKQPYEKRSKTTSH